MKKRLLCLLLAFSMVLGYFPGVSVASAEEPASKTTDFITSSVDIDALLKRDYIDNVPLGYNENVFSLYQPGWGFDANNVFRTGVAAGFGMPVLVNVDGADVNVQSAEFIPSYVTSYHTPDGAPTYANMALGAQELPDELTVTAWMSFDQDKWGCKLDYAFDGEIYHNGNKNWNTWTSPIRTGDEWVQITFSRAVTLSSAKLWLMVDTADCGPLAGAQVQYWADDAWQDVANQQTPALGDGENVFTFDAATSDQFRLVLTPTDGKAFAVDELELLDENGVNLALGAVKTDPETITDSDVELDPTLPVFRVSYSMENWECFAVDAFNGVTAPSSSGNWCTYAEPMRSGDEWVEISFPEETTLDAARLWIHTDSGNSQAPVNAVVQVKDNGQWVAVSNQVQPESYARGMNTITFDSVTAKDFRIVITPQEGKCIAVSEVELLQKAEAKKISVTGHKYITPDDKLAVMISAENLGTVDAEVKVTANSAAATTVDGNTLTGTAAGFALKIQGSEGFAVEGTSLINTVTLAAGEKAEFRVVMTLDDANAADFLADTDPLATQKEKFNAWFLETIPYVDVPDEQIQQIYYFRWYTFRNHIRMTTDDYYIISEFLPNVGWAGKHNSINCPAGHHVAEARWLKNDEYLDDYLAHWLDKGGAVRSYSFWISNAYYERYLVNQDDYVLNYVEKLKKNYDAWSDHYHADIGLYWQYDGNDGMELAVGGHGYRPTINAYQWADAMAIAEMCKLLGDEEGAELYTERANTLKATMQEKLWDPEDNFFKLIRTNQTQRVDVREEIGYVPWMFSMPDDTEEYSLAWEALMDENGFFSEYGPRTTELEYAARYPTSEYGTGMCRWDGPSWPFATSQTLVGMANVLNNYEYQAIDADDYFTILKTYTKSHYKNGAPWIAENLDADNGTWIADCWRSPNYNHSQYANLIINGLFGIRPDDTDILTVNPLTPDEWDYFCLENVPYHNKLLTIVYDRDGTRYNQGEGLQVYVDGEKLYQGDAVKEIQVELPVTQADQNKEALRKFYNENRARVEDQYIYGWAAFEQAMENAKAVLDDDNASEEELSAAYDKLQNAVDALIKSPVIRYEAEDAVCTGVCRPGNSSTASGGMKVGGIDNAQCTVTFTVEVPAAGDYLITVTADGAPAYPNPSHKYYTNGDSANWKIINYPGPEGWNVWKQYELTLTLKEGTNTITFAYNDETTNTFAEIDCIDVAPVPEVEYETVRYEAENAVRTGIVDIRTSSTASGGKFVGMIDNPEATVNFTVEAPIDGVYEMALTHDGNPGWYNCAHKYYINGDVDNAEIVRYNEYSPSGVWFTQSVFLELPAGTNTITITHSGMDASYAQLDCIDLTPMPLNQTDVDIAIALIGSIGDVDEQSGAAIEEARNAYDALNNYEKTLVTNYETLVEAECRYLSYSLSLGQIAPFTGERLELPVQVGETLIYWETSDPYHIAENGIVTRDPQKDLEVTLTATLVSEYGTETVEFNVQLLADPDVQVKEPMTVVQFGDSNTEFGWLTMNMAQILKEEHGDWGTGFVTLASNSYFQKKPENFSFVRTGGWTDLDTARGGKHGTIVDSPNGIYARGDTNAEMTIKFLGSAIDLYYLSWSGAGNFTVTIDGKDYGTVYQNQPNDYNTHTASYNDLKYGWHEMKIHINQGHVNFYGADVIIGERDQRTVIHTLGNAEATSNDFAIITKSIFDSTLQLLDPDKVVVLLGTNDHGALAEPRQPAAVEADLITILNRTKQAVPEADVWLVSTFDTNDTSKPASKVMLREYWKTTFPNAADATGVNFWDMGPWFGEWTSEKMSDPWHVNDKYGMVIMQELYKYLTGELVDSRAQKVVDLINAIGKVTEDSAAAIHDARTAYDALTDALKAQVSNYQTLLDAEELFAGLTGIQQVIDLIDTIGKVTLESGEAIEAARAAYDELTDTEQEMITNYQTLVTAEATYTNLLKASEAIALIDAIGQVTLESGEAIKAAREAFDALGSVQKLLVTNADKLIEAEHVYTVLKAEDCANSAEAAAQKAQKAYEDAQAAYEKAKEEIAEDKTAAQEAKAEAEAAKVAAELAQQNAETARAAAEEAKAAAADGNAQAAAEALKAAQEAANAAETAQQAAQYASKTAEALALTQAAQAAAEQAQKKAEEAKLKAEEEKKKAEEAEKQAEENQKAAEEAAAAAQEAQRLAELANDQSVALYKLSAMTRDIDKDQLNWHELGFLTSVIQTMTDQIKAAQSKEEIEEVLVEAEEAIEYSLNVCLAGDFVDVDVEAWYHDGVDYMLIMGYMNGISETNFAPNANTNRAMLATLLYRIAGEPSVEGLENPFTDVEEDTWYTDAVIWAASVGVVNGKTETTYEPATSITRQEMVTMLWRYAGEPETEADLSAYTDAASVGSFAGTAMAWAVENGIISGITETTLVPTGTATRAQIATILMRYLQK